MITKRNIMYWNRYLRSPEHDPQVVWDNAMACFKWYHDQRNMENTDGLIRSESTLNPPTQCSKCGRVHVITRSIGGMASGARKP